VTSSPSQDSHLEARAQQSFKHSWAKIATRLRMNKVNGSDIICVGGSLYLPPQLLLWVTSFYRCILPKEVFGMKNNQVEYAEDLLDEFVHLDIWAALYSFCFNSRYSKKKPNLQMWVCHDVRCWKWKDPTIRETLIW
jgi:hypothetical protein